VILQSDLATRIAEVRQRMAEAASRAGRDPAEVRLVAVSKTYPIEYVRAAAEAGQQDFGENRVQEALPKIAAAGDLPVRWHLVGHLQSNKARKAAASFQFIHSADGVGLVASLDKAAQEEGVAPGVLVQVDLAGEETKHGVALDGLRGLLAAASRCRALRLQGLMLLPPFFEDPEDARPYFQRLRRLRDDFLADGTLPPSARELSMGMSHDFEVAVEEGATMVRIGTAIFGPRSRP
jgi:pyridoxal phosphate enzyme (YggS family)